MKTVFKLTAYRVVQWDGPTEREVVAGFRPALGYETENHWTVVDSMSSDCLFTTRNTRIVVTFEQFPWHWHEVVHRLSRRKAGGFTATTPGEGQSQFFGISVVRFNVGIHGKLGNARKTIESAGFYTFEFENQQHLQLWIVANWEEKITSSIVQAWHIYLTLGHRGL